MTPSAETAVTGVQRSANVFPSPNLCILFLSNKYSSEHENFLWIRWHAPPPNILPVPSPFSGAILQNGRKKKKQGNGNWADELCHGSGAKWKKKKKKRRRKEEPFREKQPRNLLTFHRQRRRGENSSYSYGSGSAWNRLRRADVEVLVIWFQQLAWLVRT